MTNRIELPGTTPPERTGHEHRARSQVQFPWVSMGPVARDAGDAAAPGEPDNHAGRIPRNQPRSARNLAQHSAASARARLHAVWNRRRRSMDVDSDGVTASDDDNRALAASRSRTGSIQPRFIISSRLLLNRGRRVVSQQAQLAIKVSRTIFGFPCAQTPHRGLTAASSPGNLRIGHSSTAQRGDDFVSGIHFANIRE